jgi:hypothetical protein
MSRVRSSVVNAVLASLLTSALLVGAALAADVGSFHFTVGRKSLTKDWYLGPPNFDATGQFHEPGRAGQYSLGLETTWGRDSWPVQIAFDVFHSYDDGIIHVPAFFTTPAFDERLRASTFEAALGLRRSWDVLGLTPYLGAGGSWIRPNYVIEISNPNAGAFGTLLGSARMAEPAFGFWAGGGFYRKIGPRLQLGLEGRYSKATIPAAPLFVDGTNGQVVSHLPELDAGGRAINLVAGWSFPARK